MYNLWLLPLGTISPLGSSLPFSLNCIWRSSSGEFFFNLCVRENCIVIEPNVDHHPVCSVWRKSLYSSVILAPGFKNPNNNNPQKVKTIFIDSLLLYFLSDIHAHFLVKIVKIRMMINWQFFLSMIFYICSERDPCHSFSLGPFKKARCLLYNLANSIIL